MIYSECIQNVCNNPSLHRKKASMMGQRSSVLVQEYNIITTDRNNGQTTEMKKGINNNYSSKQVLGRCTGQMSFYYFISSRGESKVV